MPAAVLLSETRKPARPLSMSLETSRLAAVRRADVWAWSSLTLMTAEACWASRYSVRSQYTILNTACADNILLDHSTPEAVSRCSGNGGSTRLSSTREVGESRKLPSAFLCACSSATDAVIPVSLSHISRARRQEAFQIAPSVPDSHAIQDTVSISCDGSPLLNVVKHAPSQSASVSAFVHSRYPRSTSLRPRYGKSLACSGKEPH
jgi:hypothetical protein